MFSPFRYPGGKTKILPIILPYINPTDCFIDAFVGGGSVLLEIANKYPNISLFANDKNYWIYSFWKVISNPNQDYNSLITLLKQPPTLSLFYKLREEETEDEVLCAYKAIFYNRTAFSGIFFSGPIGGKEQKSKYKIDCRYNFDKIKLKLDICRKLLINRLTVSNKDCSEYELLNTNISTYIDPPYVLAGDSLYVDKMSHNDHKQLFNILDNRTNWLLSYDDCPLIRELYKEHQVIDMSAKYCISGKKKEWQNKNELIILPKYHDDVL